MSTGWITRPFIPFDELKAAEIPGLKQYPSDKGEEHVWTDGRGYLWVYSTHGNATFQSHVDSRNNRHDDGDSPVRRIQTLISNKFGVDWISEHDPGFWDEGQESPGDFESGWNGEQIQASEVLRMAFRVAARSVEARRAERKVARPRDISRPPTEYSCQLEISMTADFEGDVSKSQLLKKLEAEVIAALKAGVASAAKGFGLKATNILLKPIDIDCSVNSVDVDDFESSHMDEDDDEDEDVKPVSRSRRVPKPKPKPKRSRR